MAYLLLYVDDIFLTASSTVLLKKSIDALASDFDLTDLGKLHHFLGITFSYNEAGIFFSQQNCAADILHQAAMTYCNPCLTPIDSKAKFTADDSPPVDDPTLYRSLAGALEYLTFTRPDIFLQCNKYACLCMIHAKIT